MTEGAAGKHVEDGVDKVKRHNHGTGVCRDSQGWTRGQEGMRVQLKVCRHCMGMHKGRRGCAGMRKGRQGQMGECRCAQGQMRVCGCAQRQMRVWERVCRHVQACTSRDEGHVGMHMWTVYVGVCSVDGS